MYKKLSYLFFFGFFFTTSINSLPKLIINKGVSFVDGFEQDKRVLIKKIKAKMNALDKKRTRLKAIKKWSEAKETIYLQQLKRLADNLEKLGDTSINVFNIDRVIKKLQKELKFINNARVNANTKGTLTKKYDSIYKNQAGFLLDSIIRLRLRKAKI